MSFARVTKKAQTQDKGILIQRLNGRFVGLYPRPINNRIMREVPPNPIITSNSLRNVNTARSLT